MDWKFIQNHFDWLGHIVEALVMSVVVAVIFVGFGISIHAALVIGGAFAVGHFHGREKRDYEVSVGMRPPHLKGYFIWRWSHDQLTDFLPVLLVFVVFLGLVVVIA